VRDDTTVNEEVT